MSLFQNAVVSKYLKAQNNIQLLQKWEAYKNHFLNIKVQEDIKSLKEEQYQGEFLEDLFVKILGYTKPASSTEIKFNLTTEYKNVKDSKKADGAIIIDDKVKAVIELKGTNTTDLGKIETQAFGYKNNQPDCVYVITSNFEKIRFYIDNAIEFLEFNLFQLTQTEFELLYLCLAYDNLAKGIAKTIKDESVSQEDVITKKLYKDYSLFKRELHQNLVALNPQYEPIELFKKSQKLLDRFLFIFFAEDRNLLPTNLIFRINKEWQNLRTMRIEVSLYERYKIYFNDLNTGAKVQLPAFSQTNTNTIEEHQIFAYNGGLFKADSILDNIKIDDAVLFKHTENLSNYDFDSEVDVNILGHIFENSLNELDEITNEAMGLNPLAKGQTKRKKDGVFYTPKYITKYIVENTVGKLCQEKKTELQIIDEDYTTDKKRQKKTLQVLIDKLETYRSWLLQLTICDPACGSGAFLNQALDFLIAEHTYINELKAKLFGDALVLSDIATSILENNLFGVDLNEESVEIAKLALWLRTAQPNRKLNDLSNNIQCGNSLIDDVTIAGDKAFNWQTAFPGIFKEKNKHAYHLVFTTHNSRTSQRMIDYDVKKGPAVEFVLKEEIALTKIFKEIILEKKYNCLAYNICKDHVHIIIVCQENEVSEIAKTLKGKSSYLYQFNGFKPIGEALWSQKFFFAQLDQLVFSDISPKPGYIATDTYLENAINYIKTNREKHQLPNSKELNNCINSFTTSLNQAFKTEHSGGFDVIIGNPPYVQIKEKFYEKYFTKKCGDLYALFFEKGIEINKKNGLFGYITPSLFIKGMRYDSLRSFLINNVEIIELDDLGDNVFNDVQMPTAITILRNAKKQNQDWNKYLKGNDILNKIDFKCIKLSDISKIMRGLEIGKDKVNIGQNDVKFLTGEDVYRYGIKSISYITYEVFEEYSKENLFFEGNKILIRETGNRLTSLYIENNDFQQNRSLYSIKLINEIEYNYGYIISLLNSNIIQYYYNSKFSANTDIFPKIRIGQVKEIPIKQISIKNQQPFIEKADTMLSLNKTLQQQQAKVINMLQRDYALEKPTKKLETWYELTLQSFFAELAKAKIVLTTIQKDEVQEYFETYQKQAVATKNQITATDKQIDAMVYELYGLNEQEIAIVESSN